MVHFLNNDKIIFMLKEETNLIKLLKLLRKAAEYRNFFEYYIVHSKLGNGAFGRVYLTYNKSTKEKVATKIIIKDLDDHCTLIDLFRF